MADDLERWLKHEPIRARRPSWLQTARKWARRHQTLVWSATICSLLVLAVVGASVGWIARDRAARLAKAAEDYKAAVDQAIGLIQAEKWPEAKAAIQHAAVLLDRAGSDPVQQQRLAQAEADVETAKQLELARLSAPVDRKSERGNANALIAAAFRAHKLPVLELEPDEAARRIVTSDLREQLVAALVDWASTNTDPVETKKLRTLIQLVDGNDPWRQQFVDAEGNLDEPRLLRLAQSEEVLNQPPARLLRLGSTLARIDKTAYLTFLRQAQQRHRDDFWINSRLAWALVNLEPPHPEEAIGYFRAAVALRPQSAGSLMNLGIALKDNGQLDEAIIALRDAIHLREDSSIAHSNLGVALKDKGQLDEAIAEYQKAIELDPENAEAHNNLGVTLSDKGRLDEAIDMLRQAIQIQKDSFNGHKLD